MAKISHKPKHSARVSEMEERKKRWHLQTIWGAVGSVRYMLPANECIGHDWRQRERAAATCFHLFETAQYRDHLREKPQDFSPSISERAADGTVATTGAGVGP